MKQTHRPKKICFLPRRKARWQLIQTMQVPNPKSRSEQKLSCVYGIRNDFQVICSISFTKIYVVKIWNSVLVWISSRKTIHRTGLDYKPMIRYGSVNVVTHPQRNNRRTSCLKWRYVWVLQFYVPLEWLTVKNAVRFFFPRHSNSVLPPFFLRCSTGGRRLILWWEENSIRTCYVERFEN